MLEPDESVGIICYHVSQKQAPLQDNSNLELIDMRITTIAAAAA